MIGSLNLPDAPAIPGLVFRHFRGASDFPLMAALIAADAAADGVERAETAESLASEYANLINCDPYHDSAMAEIRGELVGYVRGWWEQEEAGPIIYGLVSFVAPEWRNQGIERALLHWVENRLREVAAGHDNRRPQWLEGFTVEAHLPQAALLLSEGYQPVRNFNAMLRPSLEDIPDFPVPNGLEVRPVLPEHYRSIFDADTEGNRNTWAFSVPTDAEYREWLANPTTFQPDLWQVAWDVATNQIAGQVLAYIDEAENEKYNRLRGYTEFITTQEAYRRRGLARALIVRSLLAQRERGILESILHVDTQNASGASRVYEDCGFRVIRQSVVFRKPLWLLEGTE